jgi:hypothetical protein
MIGNLFAFAMIAMLAGTLVLVAKMGSRPTFRSCLFGALIAMVVAVLAALGDVPHFCLRGGTVSPALLAGPLAGLVYAFVHDRAKAWLAVAVLGLSGCFLCFLGSQIVHEAHYVWGGTKWLQRNA